MHLYSIILSAKESSISHPVSWKVTFYNLEAYTLNLEIPVNTLEIHIPKFGSLYPIHGISHLCLKSSYPIHWKHTPCIFESYPLFLEISILHYERWYPVTWKFKWCILEAYPLYLECPTCTLKILSNNITSNILEAYSLCLKFQSWTLDSYIIYLGSAHTVSWRLTCYI